MKIIVTGAAQGLGAAVVKALSSPFYGRPPIADAIMPVDILTGEDVGDIRSLHHVREWAYDGLDFLINCAGINRNEWFENITLNHFEDVMRTNAYGIVSMTLACLDGLIARKGCVINIVSNAAHIPMTSSLAYNASKAAALMITKQMAHELTPKYGLTVFSVSPNKLEGTGMSRQIEENVQRVRGWTPEYAREYQRKALMHGLETPPQHVAEVIANLISTGGWKYLSGCDIPFGK